MTVKNADDSYPFVYRPVDPATCELEGPYECPCCHGHIMLDATFLDQVGTQVVCPYCDIIVAAPEEPSS